jgi:hypothetical protein
MTRPPVRMAGLVPVRPRERELGDSHHISIPTHPIPVQVQPAERRSPACGMSEHPLAYLSQREGYGLALQARQPVAGLPALGWQFLRVWVGGD